MVLIFFIRQHIPKLYWRYLLKAAYISGNTNFISNAQRPDIMTTDLELNLNRSLDFILDQLDHGNTVDNMKKGMYWSGFQQVNSRFYYKSYVIMSFRKPLITMGFDQSK